MTEFLKLLFAPCSEISRHASMALDQDLPRPHRAAIRIHYLYCKACRRYRRQIQRIREAAWELSTDKTPADVLAGVSLPPDARDRIKRSLQDR